jgi:hypothetical protein
MRHPLFALSVLIGILAASCSIANAAENTETGLLVERTAGGFWAKFARPVAEGVKVIIRISPDSWDVATGKIQWASPFPPYEAYVTDVTPMRVRSLVNAATPYQNLFNEKSPAGHVDRGDAVAPGLFVVAKSAQPGRANDVLRGLLDLLDARPEFREHLRAKNATKADWDDVHYILDNPLRLWNDPITQRIAENLRALLRERSNVQGRIPSFWFSPEETRKKSENTPTNTSP